jgi:hypothetical protein
MRSQILRHVGEALERRVLLSANPTFGFGTYLGDSDEDRAHAIAMDAEGNTWITGTTSSMNFPGGGFDPTFNGGSTDAFVAKVYGDGNLAWASYLGGMGSDSGHALVLDVLGDAWVVGSTSSTDFPTDGFDRSFNGNQDVFIAKVDPNGNLRWASYLGGSEEDLGYGIDIDATGNVWVTGHTRSSNFPGGGADPSYNGGWDAFLAKIGGDGSFAWGSYIGGSTEDVGEAVTTDGEGNAWVVGGTTSIDLTNDGFDPTFNGVYDAFVAKLSAGGSWEWSSYIGGSGYETALGIAVDAAGNLWVAGPTDSADFPGGGFDVTYNGGGNDAFIAKVNADETFGWASYLGGSGTDIAEGVVAVGSDIFVTGNTSSRNFPGGAFDATHNGGLWDTFVAKIGANGSFRWGSYIGGSDDDVSEAIVGDASGNIWLAGYTSSADFPIGGFDPSYNGSIDAMIAMITDDVTPPSVTAASYLFETAPNSVRLTFSEDISASLTGSDLIVTAVPPGELVNVSDFTHEADTNTATFTINTPMPDGNYIATLPAASVNDPAGHALATDYTLPFFVLAGDANRDRIVDITDLGILATNWQHSPRTFSQGDFNYDGVVDITDLGILATNWQASIPAARSVRGAAAAMPFRTEARDQRSEVRSQSPTRRIVEDVMGIARAEG